MPDSGSGAGAGAGAGAVRQLWTPRIDNEAQFLEFSKQLGNERFGKFVIDLKSDAIYYFDVDVFPVHKDFIFKELYKKEKTKAAVRAFDKNYGPDKPDFLMVYLVHHLAQDVWTFAFWDGDLATAAHVRHAYKRMKETFYLGDKVKFRPDSNYQEKVAHEAATGADPVPFLLNDQLYQALAYVAFNPGTAIGKLRHVPPNIPESELTFDPGEIVILHAPLADITPVAGIISESFSTPLAHVSLRARAWGIPNIGLKARPTRSSPRSSARRSTSRRATSTTRSARRRRRRSPACCFAARSRATSTCRSPIARPPSCATSTRCARRTS